MSDTPEVRCELNQEKDYAAPELGMDTCSQHYSEEEIRFQGMKLRNDWKEQFVSELLTRNINKSTDISITKRITICSSFERGGGAINKTLSASYLRDLTTYLSCMKLDPISKYNLLQKAMAVPALGWLQLKRPCKKTYEDLCFFSWGNMLDERRLKKKAGRKRKRIYWFL